MRNINSDEFLKQPIRVQENLKRWFINNSEPYDLCEIEGNIKFTCDIDKIKEHIDEIIPLLNESQLREYIEDRYNGKTEARYSAYGYTIHILIADSTGNINDEIDCIETSETDLIKAYWIVACKIAKDDDNRGHPVWEDEGSW